MKTLTAACLAAVLFAFGVRAGSRAVTTGATARPVGATTAAAKKPAALATPAIRLSKANGSSDGRAHYVIEVTNATQYPVALFAPAGPALPPNPCGDTRMFALVMVRRGAETRNVACKALPSRGAVQTIEFSVDTPLTDTDKVQFALQDRQADIHASSEWFVAGWIGIGSQLAPGCKYFLGRPDSFLCVDAGAFAECERLRLSGKAIKCTQAGAK